MPGPVAAPERELDGRQARRLTSRSAASRATTTLGTRLLDAWSTVASTAIGVAMLGGWFASLRDTIAARPPATGVLLPAAATAGVSGTVAMAGLLALLDRLGPVSASPAAGVWWLTLPASRRGLLRAELARVTGVCATAAAVLSLPLFLTWTRHPTVPAVAADVMGAALAACGLVGAIALLQTRGVSGRVAPVAGAIAVLVSAAAAGAAALPALPRSADVVSASRPSPAFPVWPLAAAVLALPLVWLADRGLGRLEARTLRISGSTTHYAAASVLSLDTRDLGRALAARRRRTRVRRWRFRAVARPWQAIAVADLLLLARSPWHLGQLLLAAAVPVLVSRTDGIDRLPSLVAGGLVLGWALAAVTVGHTARQAQAAPGIDRLLPLSPPGVVAARACVPAVLLTVALGSGGLLIGVAGGDPLAWAALALAAVPAWTAAALRGGYRPELDWSGPVMSTPMGAVPTGIGATLVQGLDVGVVGSIPAVVAVHLGGAPSWSIIAVQLAWASALGAGALALTVRRLETAGR